MSVFNKIGAYVKGSYGELVHKVSWPTRAELTNSAVVVMVASIIIALFIFLVDTVFNELMDQVYKLVI
ncbi:preprotein translocase subunit SecE [Porphyromonas crevioricanis]|uniref:Protein translocase subunit SecE n=2 Tax=Porphyromonas crevioricanis TaxID=393921 RepID=A0A0A2FHW2_9PORP|nr:preprotein translocase subunit SecE [Porphyromonas crevioricanis]KGN89645.1 preprotein translocase subunit SecE [Porphyromonas crevioricanis]KGN93800.1 preprotein translocase subunit SecE [Porphyromonas crevioricanis]SJZ79152.1 preprotein translocase subunit SecE [Porphyromonas crevioricanis]SQH72425.1 preprotein translocase subunit SecE [Porphyromonas crevioricanis]GAD04701.1 preprotein translocase subunit SecE [Porphyromonas crevioricanis JCM 15906]